MESIKDGTISCKCLNVRFYQDYLSPTSANLISSLDDQLLAHLNDGEGISTLNTDFSVISDSGGAQLSVPSLLIARTVKAWKIFSCFNCKTVVHAFNDAKNLTLVNGAVLIGPTEQNALMADSNYFPLFGIVLKATQESVVKSSLKPSLVNILHQLQDDTSEYLRSEEQFMVERVAAFKVSEKAKFEHLKQMTAKQEKDLEQIVYAAYREANDDTDSAFERSVEEISELSISGREGL